MSLACPRCGRVNPKAARSCDCGQDLSGAAHPDAAAEAGAPRRPARDASPHRCPVCHGADVRIDGWAGLETRVQFGSRWTGPGNSGYGLNCFACLDCGFVGHYLGPDDVQSLRARPIAAQAPVRRSSAGCLGMTLLLGALVVGSGVAIGRLLAG